MNHCGLFGHTAYTFSLPMVTTRSGAQTDPAQPPNMSNAPASTGGASGSGTTPTPTLPTPTTIAEFESNEGYACFMINHCEEVWFKKWYDQLGAGNVSPLIGKVASTYFAKYAMTGEPLHGWKPTNSTTGGGAANKAALPDKPATLNLDGYRDDALGAAVQIDQFAKNWDSYKLSYDSLHPVQLSPGQLLDMARARITGDAGVVVSGYSNQQVDSVATLAKILKDEFAKGVNICFQAALKLASTDQLHSVQQYRQHFNKMLALMDAKERDKVHETVLLRCVMLSHLKPDILKHIMGVHDYENKSLTALFALAQGYEQAHGVRSAEARSVLATINVGEVVEEGPDDDDDIVLIGYNKATGKQADYTHYRCHNCKEMGHISRLCPKRSAQGYQGKAKVHTASVGVGANNAFVGSLGLKHSMTMLLPQPDPDDPLVQGGDYEPAVYLLSGSVTPASVEEEPCQFCGAQHTTDSCPFEVCQFCGSEAHVSRDCPDTGGGNSAESDSDTSVVGVGSVLKDKVKAKRLTKADGS